MFKNQDAPSRRPAQQMAGRLPREYAVPVRVLNGQHTLGARAKADIAPAERELTLPRLAAARP